MAEGYLDCNSALPAITQQEFCDHIDDEDFFLTYGNPVVIRSDSGTKLLAIAFPLYERYMEICGRSDEVEVIKRECAEAWEQRKECNNGNMDKEHASEDDA